MSCINTTLQKLIGATFALFLFAPLFFVSTQTVEVAPVKARVKQKTKSQNEGGIPAEKSIAVDAKVNISLCVSEGNLKVTGWERNEIRAFVSNGSKVNFNVKQKSRQNNNAVWVWVTGFDPTDAQSANTEECLSGDEIELDVPRGATVNIKGSTSETKINSVRKVDVKHLGGDIFLNNIEQGINAVTYQGDVMVENSGGAITLETTNGNVVAFDITPGEIGDVFKAKTNSGAITLQHIEHRQNEISSTSGSIKYAGAFQSGGQYNLRTTNGTILLAIPEKSSCKINATYGYGRFSSEIKLKIITENVTSQAQKLVASIGDGDGSVNLTTHSGAIRIKKQ